ncbi:MAG: hypothetical protein Tsb0021_02390 [Chlamydiales bacterium]
MKERKKVFLGFVIVAVSGLMILGAAFFSKYSKADEMNISIEELAAQDYPEDPYSRSEHYGSYTNRKLRLIKKSDKHFDMIFESTNPQVATITLKNVDLSYLIPVQPLWTRVDPNLEAIALSEREWNHQQVIFERSSPNLELAGGDGFEIERLMSVEIAKNSLNAGMWEVYLFANEENGKRLYYQGWFRFPLGHYKDLFEEFNGVSYWKHWKRLEKNPDDSPFQVELENLRHVLIQRPVGVIRDSIGKVLFSGEQMGKKKSVICEDLACWSQFYELDKIKFAEYIPPGRFSLNKLKGHQYDKIANVKKAMIKKIQPPGERKIMDELELILSDEENHQEYKFIVSGFELDRLPRLDEADYDQGFYMPMGISVPPFYQRYEELIENPPQISPYFSLILTEDDRWVNPRSLGIEGPVMHRDIKDPKKYHLYFLSYGRQSLVGHYTLQL